MTRPILRRVLHGLLRRSTWRKLALLSSRDVDGEHNFQSIGQVCWHNAVRWQPDRDIRGQCWLSSHDRPTGIWKVLLGVYTNDHWRHEFRWLRYDLRRVPTRHVLG